MFNEYKVIKNCNLQYVCGTCLLTPEGYYHGSTVVPVVVPVFWSFLSVGWKRNFLYELKGDLKWYE